MPTTVEAVQNIGNGMQAVADALKATGLPIANSLGNILNAAGIYIAGGATAIAESAGDKPISQVIGQEAAKFIGGMAGAAAVVSLAANIGLIGTAISIPFAIGSLAPIAFPLSLAIAFGVTAASAFGGAKIGENIAEFLYENLENSLQQLLRDPLVLDLDGDGIEVTPLDGSSVHFDYDGDGFAERTGWVTADDGMLVIDDNGNGMVDGAVELFGSPTQDGFAVLETLDGNNDGVIDAQDVEFAKLRVWRDLNQNGVSEAGELQTLAEAGIASISLARTDLPGTVEGHTIGFGGSFTWANGTTGSAQTIYFQTNRQDTQDNTPPFTPAEGIDELPFLPGSGTIHSIAYKATNDAAFRAAWTLLTDQAAGLNPSALRAQFETLLLQWAGVDGVHPNSRGPYVDARHLAFVEAFFGETYREIQRGNEVRTYPGQVSTGRAVEASFQQIVSVLETVFLAQTARSVMAREGSIETAIESPYFFYALLQFSDEEGNPAPASPENVRMVADLIATFAPTAPGAAASYLTKALLGLEGMVTIAFEGDRQAYAATIMPSLSAVTDPVLNQIAASIVNGSAIVGSVKAEGIAGTDDGDVFLAGGGGDFIDSRAGSDTVVYNKGDGNLWVRDGGESFGEVDRLILTDLNASDVSLTRVGDNLVIKITATSKTITVEDFFWQYGEKAYGIDTIRFADGVEWNRPTIQKKAVYKGDTGGNTIIDSALDDVVRGGRGDDFIKIGRGSDTVIYGRGDGNDIIEHTSSYTTEHDTLLLTNLNPEDVVFSRAGQDLLITITSTGEALRDKLFFYITDSVSNWKQYGYGFEFVRFANGTVWDRDQIQREAWLRGNASGNTLVGSGLSETFEGGQGDDVFRGGIGGDTYIWKKGDGNDRIDDFGHLAADVDTLVLKDVCSDEVSLAYHGGTVLLTVEATGEILELDHTVLGAENLLTDWNRYAYGIDAITFADGVTWNRQQIFARLGTDFIGKSYGTVRIYLEAMLISAYWYDEFGNKGDTYGNDEHGPHDRSSGDSDDNQLEGTSGHNVLHGYGGNDVLSGGGGHDILYGDDGNDVLLGGDGYDILYGQAGNDTLYGGDGLDRLVGWNGNDLLYGGDGKDYLSGGGGDDTIIGGSGDDVIASDDIVSGSDTFVYEIGDGHDTILDETYASYHAGQTDILLLSDLTAADLELTRSGNDLLIKVLGTGELIRIIDQFNDPTTAGGRGVELIRFANGEEWTRPRIHQEGWYRGTDTKDLINSNDSGVNTFIGGLGNDLITSGDGLASGSDTFLYAEGDGNDIIFDTTLSTYHAGQSDTLRLSDLTVADLEFSRSGYDLLIKVLGTGELIRIIDQYSESSAAAGKGMEIIRFADGEAWGRLRIHQEGWYRGTHGNDSISGSTSDDNTFFGGRGDDFITSDLRNGDTTGSDTFVYTFGDGNDVISDTTVNFWHAGQSDTLRLTDLNAANLEFTRSSNDLLIRVLSTSEVIRVVNQFYQSADAAGSGLEVIRFADGEAWSRETIYGAVTAGVGFVVGTVGNDILTGGAGKQSIYGEAGNDTLDGGGGSDLLYGGTGNDTILISQSVAGDIDTLQGGAGTDTASFEGFTSAVWVDLVTNGNEARTKDRADLSTGTWRGIAEIATLENVIGTAFSDQLFGDASANALIGSTGNDALDGRSGNDTLDGGAGADTLTGGMDHDMLNGGEGNDVLVGGLGGDVLTGGAGSDVAVFTGTGFGRDILTDFQSGAGSEDVLEFSLSVFSGFDAALAASTQVGADVVITVDAGSTVTLRNVQLSALHADDFRFV